MKRIFTGLIAAAYTPFHDDLSVNYARIPAQLDYLLATGVGGVLVGGTTGEGCSLTNWERKQLAETWKRLVPADFPLIVHVGHNAYRDVNELAHHAQQLGVDAILLSTPNYLRPASVDDLIRFHQLSLVDISLPTYYYHIPSVTGVSFNMADLLERIDGALPDFRGIKFTYEDLDDFNRCLRYQDGRYEMIFGRDELLLDALELGAQAALGSTYNFMAPLFTEMIDAHHRGQHDRARQLQQEAIRIINIMVRFGGGVVAGKAMMKLAGVDCGPLRPPLASLTPDQLAQLEEALQTTGFSRYRSKNLTKSR